MYNPDLVPVFFYFTKLVFGKMHKNRGDKIVSIDKKQNVTILLVDKC